MFQRVQMISSQCAFLKHQVSEINKRTHTNTHNVTIKTTLNNLRRNTQINVLNQHKTYQQIKNKPSLLTQPIMQTLGIKSRRSVNSMTKIASVSLVARLWHLMFIHEDNDISHYHSVAAALRLNLVLKRLTRNALQLNKSCRANSSWWTRSWAVPLTSD